jgi:two-component system, sensor histidine kinase and response regulator
LLNQPVVTNASYLWVGQQEADLQLQGALDTSFSGRTHYLYDVSALADISHPMHLKYWECLVVDLSHAVQDDVFWKALPLLFTKRWPGVLLVNSEQVAALTLLDLPANWLLQIKPVHPVVLVQNIKLLTRDHRNLGRTEDSLLRQSLDVALTSARLNHWRVDLKNNQTYPGPLDEEFFGMVAHSIEQLTDVIHPDDLERFVELGLYGTIVQAEHYAVEYRVKIKDSPRWRWLSSFARHIKQSSDDPGWIVGVTWDVTERKETEMALEKANKKLLAALDAANMIYFEWNIKTGERNAIGQQEKVLGQTPESISDVKSLMHPDDFLHDEALIEQSLESGEPYQNQFRIRLPNGGFKWLQSFASVINDSEGNRTKLSGICFDITERMNIFEQLQQSEAQLKRAVAAGKLISWEWLASGGLKSGVGAFEEIIGVASDAMSADKFHTFVHPEDMSNYRFALKNAVDKKTDYHCEFRLIRPDGEPRWMLSHGVPTFDAHGNIDYIAGVAVDITARKAVEQNLKDSLNWLNLVVQAAEINTYSIDLLTSIRQGGPLDHTMYGFSPGTIKELEELIHPDDRVPGRDAIAEAILHKKPYRIRYRVCRPGHQARWHESMAMPEFNEYDQAIRISGIAFDVHERMEQTAALESALQRAEKATKSKSAFLASMSHEIRTPMNAVVGVSELLSKSELNLQQKDWINTLMNSSDQLLELINEILDFSKLDAGAMQLHPVDFCLNHCIESSVSMIAASAAAKGLSLTVTYPVELLQTVNADITRIRQILVNLLSNAVKFTEVGGIVVAASLHQESMDNSIFEFRVKDSGIGMNTETVSRLFLPFSQGDTTFTRRFGGTGLGLSICKQLSDLMGGAISLNTELGVGTEFSLRIPLRKVKPLPENKVDEAPLQNKNIALIAISDAISSGIQKQIEHFGGSVEIYKQASEIDDELASAMDLLIMPKQTMMLNDTHTKRLLEKIPCVLLQLYLTAAYEQDFDKKLNKETLHYPYLPSQLLVAINKSLGVSPADVPIFDNLEKNSTLAGITQLRILVVEDNEINQYVLLAMLESIGCTATIANDGLQAVNEFEANDFDVILMDIEMPNMDGMQATHAIRKHPHIKQPYIVALTAHVMPDSRSKFMQAGMNDYVSKPILMEHIISALCNARDHLTSRA